MNDDQYHEVRLLFDYLDVLARLHAQKHVVSREINAALKRVGELLQIGGVEPVATKY